ncbi:MAG: PQQ-binding-like beta-propeller repeat protein [Melioribacteraceae bacterium]|nr:PQQ-binding-like beta-propeller repeat protein [Melioribacteraceae bacterium]
MKKITIFVLALLCSIRAQENYTLYWTGNHSGYVRTIAISSNGAKVFSGGDDKTVKAWNTSNGSLLWTSPFDGRVNWIDVSSDGTRVVAASSDKTVKMLDAETGAQLWIMTDVDVVIAALFCSFDTRVMIADEDNLVKCLNATNGNVVWSGIHDSNFNTGVNFLSISGNGNFAVSGSDRFIKVWNITTQLQVMIASTASNISTVYFNNDWSKVVSADWSGNVRIRNATTGVSIQSMVHTGIVNAAKYSPDGSVIASIGSDRNVKLWNAVTGQQVWMGNHNDEVVSLAFSPDGNRIATGSGSTESLIRVWNTSNGNLIWTSPAGQAGQTVSRIIYSPDGNKIINANHQSNSIKYWTKVPTNINEQKTLPTEFTLLQNYPNPFNPETTIKFSIPNSQHVILKVYDLLGRETTTLVNENKMPGKYSVKLSSNDLPLSSGIYIYTLTVGELNQSRKMVLLK